MLNSVWRLWRSWRERRRLAPDSLPGGDESLPEQAEEPALPEPMAVPVQDRPEPVSRQIQAPGAGLARQIKNRTRPGVLRQVDRVLPTRISRPRSPTYHIMPTVMQHVSALPLPLVKQRTENALTGEPTEGESAPAEDTVVVDAAWDALWTLRGTPSITARPTPSVAVPERLEPLLEKGAEMGIQAAEPAAGGPVVKEPVAGKPTAVAHFAAPSPQRITPETAPRPLARRVSGAVYRSVPSPIAAPEDISELPPLVSHAAVKQAAESAVPEPVTIERAQTSFPERHTMPLPTESLEPVASLARPASGALSSVPIGEESAAPVGQKVIQPAAPPSTRPVARHKVDLPVRPIARRYAAPPGQDTILPAHPPALPASSGQRRPPSSIQARRPPVAQSQIPDRPLAGRPESAAEQVSPPVMASEQTVPPMAAESRPLVASLRAGLQKLRMLRRPTEGQPVHKRTPGPAAETPLHPTEPEPAAPLTRVTPTAVWPVARRSADSTPLAQPARAVTQRPQALPPAMVAVRPTAAAMPAATSATAPAAAPFEEPSLPAQPALRAATPRPIARRLMDSVPPLATNRGAQVPRVAAPSPLSPPGLAGSELAESEPATMESRAAQVTAAQEPPAVEIAPVARPAPERTKAPLETSSKVPPGAPLEGSFKESLKEPVARAPDFPSPEELLAMLPAEGAPEPAATWADTQSHPVGTATVQRTIRDEQDLVRRQLAEAFQPRLAPTTVQAASEILAQPAAASSQAAGEQEGSQAQDIESLSRQVYQIIRRRLAVERERERGR